MRRDRSLDDVRCSFPNRLNDLGRKEKDDGPINWGNILIGT